MKRTVLVLGIVALGGCSPEVVCDGGTCAGDAAGQTDSGVETDSGVLPDSGYVCDAGCDAGVPDAGVPDSGTPYDAGTECDAGTDGGKCTQAPCFPVGACTAAIEGAAVCACGLNGSGYRCLDGGWQGFFDFPCIPPPDGGADSGMPVNCPTDRTAGACPSLDAGTCDGGIQLTCEEVPYVTELCWIPTGTCL